MHTLKVDVVVHTHKKQDRIDVNANLRSVHRYRGGRYHTLRHLDPGMGLNFGVFGVFPVIKIIVVRQVRKLIACTAG